MNYFEPKNAAERYSKGRPFFHSNTIQHIKDFVQITHKFDKALDIACGTGLSTKALLDISENVYGTDTSEEMLKWALSKDKINYLNAPAENQPFNDNEFDLITVCSGVHWFKIDEFLNEAYRLLKNEKWLILYDNFFISEMIGVNDFSQWYPDTFLDKFPAPKRNDNYNWTNQNLESKHFNLIHIEEFKNSVEFTKDELILYFTTQSNVTASIDKGEFSYQEIEKWLDHELSQFYVNTDRRTINFGNWVKYIKKNKPSL